MSHEPAAAKAKAHETKIRRWSTFTPPQSATHAALCGLFLLRRSYPPIDWSKIRSYEDLTPFFDRDGSIASVMEKEVLSKHRKALMLFGIFHLLHGGGPEQGDAVTRYERHYPGRTFVISDLGYYGVGDEPLADVNAPGGVWPSLLRTKNSRIGSFRP